MAIAIGSPQCPSRWPNGRSRQPPGTPATAKRRRGEERLDAGPAHRGSSGHGASGTSKATPVGNPPSSPEEVLATEEAAQLKQALEMNGLRDGRRRPTSPGRNEVWCGRNPVSNNRTRSSSILGRRVPPLTEGQRTWRRSVTNAATRAPWCGPINWTAIRGASRA